MLTATWLSFGAAAAFSQAGPALVTASSVFDPTYRPEYAVDGDPETRWASQAGTGTAQWLQLDFGRPVPIEGLTIDWERAYAVEYELQTSEDGATWNTVSRRTDGKGGKEVLDSDSVTARHLRIYCVRPGPFPLFSIWEIGSEHPGTQQAITELRQRMVEARLAATREARRRMVERLARKGDPGIIFAVRQPGIDGHWYANFGYYAADLNQKCYRAGGGKLCRLDPASGKVGVLFEDPHGSIRDPQVHYEGRRIVFSYLKADSEHFHLFEINADGTELRQLTNGDCDDIEPTYLPDGGIMFCSSRCNRWVNCWLTPVATLYRCDGDGRNVRIISANVEHDNTPWVLPDGRVLYMRWEYVDRSQVHYHHLWTANPDGTEQMTFFGNMHPGIAMLDAKPIPGTRKVVAIFSLGHGQREHAGPVTIVDPGDGPDDTAFTRTIPAGNDLRDPYPLDEQLFIAARGAELQLIDAEGNAQPLYRLPAADIEAGMWCHEPRVLAPRPRERVIPPRVDLTKAAGELILTNIYDGRNMAGVKPGEIKKLLVLETLPKPINYTGGMDPLSYGGTFTLERILGTVPVEPDGSAYMELPALRPLFFVALDENDMSVKRMQSFLTVQPGEVTSCVGCHEQRTRTVLPKDNLIAVRRLPSPIAPLKHVPDVFDFPRDIQPILDRHCMRCHGYERAAGATQGPRAGGVVLTGDRGPMFSHSYFTLTYLRQFVDGRNDPKSNLPPRSIGAVASPIMNKLQGRHYGVEALAGEIDMVRYWIESGAPYPGTYGALGGGSIGGYYANQQVETDFEWPESKTAAEAITRRCDTCHTGATVLPKSLSDEMGLSFWRPNWDDPRLKHSRHIAFNLSRPEQSLMLLAPLAESAGGYGICRQGARAIFADSSDADYQRILALCRAGSRRLGEIKRFDMPGFRPPEPYVREMVRYGILPATPEPDRPIDPYALDRAYWRAQWFVPRRAIAADR